MAKKIDKHPQKRVLTAEGWLRRHAPVSTPPKKPARKVRKKRS